MKIKVIDAFGTHIGDAEVKWIQQPGTRRQQLDYRHSIIKEIGGIFDEKLIVPLPTRNPQAPWRLEIDTDG